MAPRTGRDGSSSICTAAAYSPIAYHWYTDVPGEKVLHVVRRIAAAIPMPEGDRSRLVGEISGRFTRLKVGALVPVTHIAGPMESARGIDVFEVRGGVDFGMTQTAQIRVYHVEPSGLRQHGGSTVVGLHAHHKVTDEGVDVNTAQDAEIQVARDRFFAGQSTSWNGAALPLPRIAL